MGNLNSFSWLHQQCGVNSEELLYEDIKPRSLSENFIDTKFDFYTPEWEWLPVKNGHPNAGATKKPKKLEEMLSYARILSKAFPLVRVDLYCEEDCIMFGELTFLHYGGLQPFVPDEFDTKFGDMFPFESIKSTLD